MWPWLQISLTWDFSFVNWHGSLREYTFQITEVVAVQFCYLQSCENVCFYDLVLSHRPKKGFSPMHIQTIHQSCAEWGCAAGVQKDIGSHCRFPLLCLELNWHNRRFTVVCPVRPLVCNDTSTLPRTGSLSCLFSMFCSCSCLEDE